MKYLKLFEEINIKQQPLFLSPSDRLYVSDDFAKYITEYGTFKDNTSDNWKKLYVKYNKEFLNDERDSYDKEGEKAWAGLSKPYKRSYAYTNLTVRYDKNTNFKGGGTYAMNILLYRHNRNNNSGNFKYYIGGNSGDFEMHGKSMIRATRNCNYNLICKFFPIFLHIKDAYKKLKQGEPFYQLIENELDKNPSLENYLNFEYLKGLENYPDIESKMMANKYNL